MACNSTSPLQLQQLMKLQLHLWGYAGTGLSLLGMAGNALSIRVLCSRRMHSSTALYLAAQGCLDIVILILFDVCMSLPLVSSVFESLTSPNSTLIMILYPLSLLIHMCSMYVTACFTVERCLSARFPLRSAAAVGQCGRRRVWRRLLAIALFSLIYNAPRSFEKMKFYSFGGRPVEANASSNATSMEDGWSLMDNWWYRGIYSGVMYSLFMYILPLTLIGVSNIVLVHTIRRSTRRATQNSLQRQQQQRLSPRGPCRHSSQQMKRLERDRSISRMLVGVVAVFVVCQTFPLIDNIVAAATADSQLNSPGRWQQAFYIVAQFMVVLNSSVNFILYCFFGQRFRRELRYTVCGGGGGRGGRGRLKLGRGAGGGREGVGPGPRGSNIALYNMHDSRSPLHGSPSPLRDTPSPQPASSRVASPDSARLLAPVTVFTYGHRSQRLPQDDYIQDDYLASSI